MLIWVSNGQNRSGRAVIRFCQFLVFPVRLLERRRNASVRATTRTKLLASDVKFVLLVSGATDRIQSGIGSIRDNGFPVETDRVTEIGNDAAPVYSAFAHITVKPP